MSDFPFHRSVCCGRRNHERPADAFVVTDTNGRHSLFLRGADSTAAAATALRAAASLIPGPQTGQQRPAAAAGRPSAQPPPSAASAPGPRLPEAPQPQPVSHGRAPSLAEDEAFARRLQASVLCTYEHTDADHCNV